MQNIELQKVTESDIDELQNISRQTFYETFHAQNTEANMTQYLEANFSKEKLTAELNDANASFYIALLDETAVGYLKINVGHAQTELKEDNALEIERIYVSKAFQGKKVGQLLFDKAIEVAKEKEVDYVWLGVWDQNVKAIEFYKKNGFVAFDQHLFQLGDDAQTDIMMKLQLKA